MKVLRNISRVYFIGIGGIGMSAIARYFLSIGAKVSGYDKTVTALTKEMEEEGISIHYSDDITLLDKKAELVVFTPAVPVDHAELNYYQANGYQVVKRSEVLGEITRGGFSICVAGTHGKTTISTMIAHILRNSGFGCNAFLGGIAVNYQTNFWSSEKNTYVAEADEYDRSFLRLSPDVAVVSAMDADHLDIYGTEDAMQDAFVEFSKKLKPGGLLISKFGLPRDKEFNFGNHLRYSLQNDNADIFAANIKMLHGGYKFDWMKKDIMIGDIMLNMGGMHNVENAVAAITVAHYLGIEPDAIRKAVSEFKGVRRRFEYLVKNERVVFVDDYAHHPEELKALISGAKTLFGNMKSTVVFQPHLYSRTRDLAKGFAQSLDMADEVILLPIYPARELPIDGVTSGMILDEMKNSHKQLMSKTELLEWVKNSAVELFITAGAGDIDNMTEDLKQILEHKN